MSPTAAAEFTEQWSALERRLVSFLRVKGVAADDLDDLVQEIATRLLCVWHKVDRTKEPWPLVVTIALNLLRDRHRKRIFEVLGELPDIAVATDAADAGIARIELAEVFRAMETLTPSQRAALLRALEPSRDQVASTAADKMLRLRARRRLANVVGRASAGLALRFRQTSEALHAFFTKGEGAVQALLCASCLFVTAAGPVGLADGFGVFGDPGQSVRGDASIITVDGASVASLADLGGTVGSTEQLRPDRGTTAAATRHRSGMTGATRDGAANASSDDAGGTTLPLPSDPLPDDPTVPAPNPPSTPDEPSAPSAPKAEAGTGMPEESPVQVPVPVEPDDVVEEVTKTTAKVTR